MTPRLRQAALPAAALGMVVGVIGVQLANGGGSFEPLRTADPCATRPVSSTATGVDGLSERLVLLGIDGAACRLHLSREALALRLAQSDDPSDAEIDALRSGMLDAVRTMKDDGTLPPVSSLVDDLLATSDLNALVKVAIRAIPDAVIDAALPTDDVLTRTIDDLDLRALLANVDDSDALNQQIQAAVTRAVQESLTDRLRNLG